MDFRFWSVVRREQPVLRTRLDQDCGGTKKTRAALLFVAGCVFAASVFGPFLVAASGCLGLFRPVVAGPFPSQCYGSYRPATARHYPRRLLRGQKKISEAAPHTLSPVKCPPGCLRQVKLGSLLKKGSVYKAYEQKLDYRNEAETA